MKPRAPLERLLTIKDAQDLLHYKSLELPIDQEVLARSVPILRKGLASMIISPEEVRSILPNTADSDSDIGELGRVDIEKGLGFFDDSDGRRFNFGGLGIALQKYGWDITNPKFKEFLETCESIRENGKQIGLLLARSFDQWNQQIKKDRNIGFPGFLEDMVRDGDVVLRLLNYVPDATRGPGRQQINEACFTLHLVADSGKINIYGTESGETSIEKEMSYKTISVIYGRELSAITGGWEEGTEHTVEKTLDTRGGRRSSLVVQIYPKLTPTALERLQHGGTVDERFG